MEKLNMNLLDSPNDLPSSVSMYGWCSFSVIVLAGIIFAAEYIKYFKCRVPRDKLSTVVSLFGLSIALISALLLPVDVFLVSFMKNDDGTFKSWATNATRQYIEDTVSVGYYTMYGISFFCTFFLLPLAYFSYEERDEDNRTSFKVFITALIYTLVFLLVISGLLIAGVFIPFKKAPPQNTTEWEKMEFLIKELYLNKGKDAVSFVVNILTIYGMMNLILYTSVGLASFPVTMIRGVRSLSEEAQLLSNNQAETQAKMNSLRSKQARKKLSSRERSTLSELEEQENLNSRRSTILESERRTISYKCESPLRILNALIGIIAIVFSLVLFISLLISNIDKVMNSLGMRMGYVLKENVLPNPLDYIMTQSQKVFPIDYVLFFCILIFLLICTISALRYLGICCLFVRMYRIRPKRTPPQALIMLSFILMFTVLGFHILMFSVLPTYTTFGSQVYCKPANDTINANACTLQPCSLNASPDECIMSRAASFIIGFAYKAWIFAAIYYWMTWVFLVVFAVSFVIALVKSRHSTLEEAVDRDDFDDSDEPMLRS